MRSFSVSKSIVIQSPIEPVYGAIRDFKQWPAWSPWLIAEPDCALTFDPDGRSYGWNGPIAGAGETLIVGETRSARIDLRIVFTKPWKSVASVSFDLSKEGEDTRVTWSMESSLPIFLFWMRSMMAALVGMDYQRGLLMLKDYLETGSVPSKLNFIGTQEISPIRYTGIRTKCQHSDIGDYMGDAFKRLAEAFKSHGLKPCGHGFAIYHQFKVIKGVIDFTAAMPHQSAERAMAQGLVSGAMPAMRVYSIRHTGPYRHLGNAWAAGRMREHARLFRPFRKFPPFEVYENDCGETPERELLTTVKIPMH